MCGRFSLAISPDKLAELFQTINFLKFTQQFNIAPSQPIVGIRAEKKDRFADVFRWGLVPFWAKDIQVGQRLTNARAETLSQKPSFRAAYKYRRCILPASGFFEWKKMAKGKQPYHIRMRDQMPMAMAGLWETWTQPEGSELISATIITTEANSLMTSIHHRMPVLLGQADYDRWLDPTIQNPKVLGDLLKPFPVDQMEAFPVSQYVNRAGQEGLRCIAPMGRVNPKDEPNEIQGELF